MDYERFFNLNAPGIDHSLAPGIVATIYPGDQAMISVVRFEPGAKGAVHQYPEEQWGLCWSGAGVRIEDGRPVPVSAGDFWHTAGDVPHGMEAGDDGLVMIKMVAPPRGEYKTTGSGFAAAGGMTVRRHAADFHRMEAAELAGWAKADAAGMSDCLERGMAMDGGIQSLHPGMRVVGQARTVHCMVGDNSALHAAIDLARPGEVLVADAGGFLGNAVWGGLLSCAALKKGIAGLVVDGAVRDREEIGQLGFPCYARGTVPAGPYKGFGGAIDGPISCGGVAVSPGDLIVADGDGVTVVPLARAAAVLQAFRALKQREAAALKALDAGSSLGEVYGVPTVVPV